MLKDDSREILPSDVTLQPLMPTVVLINDLDQC